MKSSADQPKGSRTETQPVCKSEAQGSRCQARIETDAKD